MCILEARYLLAKIIGKEEIVFKQQHVALDVEETKGDITVALCCES